MSGKKRGEIRTRALKLIEKSRGSGIKQKELEQSLGISKSYCSEVISGLAREGRVERIGEIGKEAAIYLTEYYPHRREGLVRVGLLKSTEYIPAMSFLLQYFESNNARVLFRFFDGTSSLLDDLRNNLLEFAFAPTSSLILTAILSPNIRIYSGLASGGSGIVFQDQWERNALLSTEVSSMITMSLKISGNNMDEIQTFDDPADGLKRFIGERYRSITIWEPYLTMLEERIVPSKIIRYRDILGNFPCCSMATTDSFADVDSELFNSIIPKFMNNKITGLEHKEWFAKAVNIIAENLGIDTLTVEKSLKSYDFSDKKIDRNQIVNLGISLSKRQEEEIFTSGLLMEKA